MGREVLTSQDYQYQEPGYLVDNLPWQEEIHKRLEEESKRRLALEAPVVELKDFEPLSLPEPLEPEEIKPPEPTAEEIFAKLRMEAEENARSIEQGARKNAFEILEQARWEANDLAARTKEDAEKEAQQLKDTAQEEGRKVGEEKGRLEGVEIGRTEGRETYSEEIKKWQGLAEQTVLERKKLLGDLKPLLVELVGQGLNRCLKAEAEKHNQMVVDFAQEALSKVQDRVHLRLHLNPEDIAEVEAQKERLGLSVGAKGLELVPDARVERGGCILETEAGSVDVQVPTVVAKLKEALDPGSPWK